MNDSKHASGLDLLSSVSDTIGFDVMNEPMIPTQHDPNDYDNKDDDSTCVCEDDNIAYSNEDFDLHAGDVDDFMEKVFDEDNVTKDTNDASHCANDNKCNLTAKEIA